MKLADVKIGSRRRNDLGDIGSLAESLRRYGLLHPIVVDANGRLVAGERRLQAATLLGWTEIDARSVGDLSDAELREIELEENLRRKDLTPLERSRKLVELAETAEGLLATSAKTTGRPPKGAAPEQAVAERIGVPRRTLGDAKAHVAAVDRYPELTRVGGTQKDVLTIARNLDRLDDDARVAARSDLIDGNQATLAALAEKPPPSTAGAPASSDAAARWTKAIADTAKLVNSIGKLGGGQVLVSAWRPDQRRGLAAQATALIDALTQIRDEIAPEAEEAA